MQREQAMLYEIDHIFLCCSVGGPEAELLKTTGLTEGSPNLHPGQGTACRRFFFANAYLELLWVSDPSEAQSETTSPTRLLERWRGRTGKKSDTDEPPPSPFGMGLRPSAPTSTLPPPFESWAYAPPYLPPGLSIDFAVAAPLQEPELFFMRHAKRPDARTGVAREPLTHPLGISQITSVAVTTPAREPWSPATRSIAKHGIVAYRSGPAHCLELGFDGEQRGEQFDLRPQIPLILRR